MEVSCSQVRDEHQAMADSIKSFTRNSMMYASRHKQGREGMEMYAHKKGIGIEFVLSVMLRFTNQKVIPFLVMCISLIACLCHTPHTLWQVLMKLKVVIDKKKVEEIGLHIADNLAPKLYGESRGLCFLVFDNCDYFLKVKHIDTKKVGEMLHTVNWITVNLDHLDLDDCYGLGGLCPAPLNAC